jgi:hypothetical protein
MKSLNLLGGLFNDIYHGVGEDNNGVGHVIEDPPLLKI